MDGVTAGDHFKWFGVLHNSEGGKRDNKQSFI